MTGDLKIGSFSMSGAAHADRLRTMGCSDLGGSRIFAIRLGNGYNKMICRLNDPVTIQASSGIVCRQGADTNIIRFGKAAGDPKIDVYQDIVMNQKRITDLKDPVDDRDAATKMYVEKVSRRNCTGHIPNLEADESTTGFVARSSSDGFVSTFRAYMVFNHKNEDLLSVFKIFEHGDIWVQINCPAPVAIWRIALKAERARCGMETNIAAWNLSASNDGSTFTTLLESTAGIPDGSSPLAFCNISTTTAYQ